jgi:hypothetical protein
MKKSKALIVAGALLASVLLSTEASAAAKISNGVSCTTKQKNTTKTQVTKDVTDKYKCTINPTATGSAKKKLVWVNQDCIDMNKLYVDGIADLAKLKADTTATPTQVSTQESFVDSAKTYRSIACDKGF